MIAQSSYGDGKPRSSGRLVLGPFTLDGRSRVLYEGTRQIPLGSRAMDMLLLLVERAGGLVTQDELAARAWPDMVVADVNLRVHISALRRALGGSGGARFIATVPGRGYRFVASVRAELGANQPQSAATNPLPSLPPSGAVGRADLLDRIVQHLPRCRMITVVGPGGMGKTTVAIAAATALATDFTHGARWIDLGVLARGESVAMAVAQVIGLASFTQDPTQGVIAWLRERQMLLVFDCCERVVAAAAAMAEQILRETGGVRILATSREALRAAGEHVVRLPPLTTPAQTAALSASEACRFPAVQLFVERAASVLGGFVLREEDVPLVVRICARLDGIALAIELAAGHLVAFDLRRLAALLDDKFALLPAGRRTSVARHQTMHAALEWSYDMLSAQERAALLGLSVFESGAHSAAVSAVLSATPTSAATIVEALARLTDKSLVNAAGGADGLAYRLLDTTRAFALERLAESSEGADIRRRHATYMMQALHRLGAQEPEAGSAAWLFTRRQVLPDIRAALAWACGTPGQDALVLEIAAEAVVLLYGLSLADECRRRTTEALNRMERTGLRDKRIAMRLRAILAAASLYTPGPLPRLLALWDDVLALAVELGDVENEAAALFGLLSASIHRNEPEQALRYIERFRALAVSASDETRVLVSDRMAAIALHLNGQHVDAHARLREMVARYDATVHGWSNFGFRVDHGLMAQATLARVLWFGGKADQAIRLCRSCVAALLEQDHAIALCYALFEVAIPLYCLMGDLSAAQREVRLLKQFADRHGLVIFQAGAAWTQLALNHADEAACRAAADELAGCGYAAQRPFLCALMAQAALLRRDPAAGLGWVAPLLSDAQDMRGCWVPELLRLRAELTLQAGGPDAEIAADRDLGRGREIAASQAAPALELRVAISQARLATDNAPARRRDLAALLDRFGEGFATVDYEAARVVLAG